MEVTERMEEVTGFTLECTNLLHFTKEKQYHTHTYPHREREGGERDRGREARRELMSFDSLLKYCNSQVCPNRSQEAKTSSWFPTWVAEVQEFWPFSSALPESRELGFYNRNY